jgi:hypothetical protein
VWLTGWQHNGDRQGTEKADLNAIKGIQDSLGIGILKIVCMSGQDKKANNCHSIFPCGFAPRQSRRVKAGSQVQLVL